MAKKISLGVGHKHVLLLVAILIPFFASQWKKNKAGLGFIFGRKPQSHKFDNHTKVILLYNKHFQWVWQMANKFPDYPKRARPFFQWQWLAVWSTWGTLRLRAEVSGENRWKGAPELRLDQRCRLCLQFRSLRRGALPRVRHGALGSHPGSLRLWGSQGTEAEVKLWLF